MTTRLKRLFAGAFALGALVTTAAAQCPPMPDNLDGGPCCTRAFETLPQFPKFKHQIFNICWKDCQVDQLLNYSANWGATNFVVTQPGAQHCGVRTSLLVIRNSANQVAYAGNMRLQYSRTWVEVATSGITNQVWRFLVNGDLFAMNGAGASPCPRPPCAASFLNQTRYTGYIDYLLDCSSFTWSNAWMLTHACDMIDHVPGVPRGGNFHPDRAYTFVGPSAGFVVNSLVPFENGPITAETVRRSALPPVGSNQPIDCEFEDFQAIGFVSNNQTFCLCGQSTGPQQYAESNLSALGYCGSSVVPQGTPPTPGFLSMGIGSWTNPNVFPGVEELRWNCGNYSYFEPCTGITRQEFFFGVTTSGGDPAYQFLTVGGITFQLDKTFIDQSNSLRLKSGTLVLNLPYVSDHFLNLNVP